MNYYVLEGTFRNDIPESTDRQKAIDAHLKYLKSGFENGSILVSGPKAGNIGGGIIVLKFNDIDAFCQNDPLVQAGVQEYRVTEFTLFDCQDFLKSWFSPSE